ncbi:MAG: putative manganese-dependent inorganic diphosphatase, partial [Oscillospiraceae bacterium]|nr:putative manganese-dependent inorganic diphosphatase [Oscillospiraceae bacterium]
MADHQTSNRVSVIGHKHPDTDSICSAIAYAWLKNKTGDGSTNYLPRRAGEINRETEFVLNYFGVPLPDLREDARPQIKDAEYRIFPGIDREMSLKDAWSTMIAEEIDTLCITDGDNNFEGIITLKDIGQSYMTDDLDVLARAGTRYRNLVKTLDGELVVGDPEAVVANGKLVIGSSPEMMEEVVSEGDIVLVSNRYETQSFAVDCGAGCIVVCCGARLSRAIIRRAEENGCAIVSTPMDTYPAARQISMAAPVSHKMVTQDILKFNLDTPVEEVRKVMASVRHRYFPVMDHDGKYCGVISRRNLMNPHRKQLILVDHNEKTQAISGLDEAVIVEIIDHHRLGALETGEPVFIRSMPVGCTSTILWRIFREENVTPPREIAGMMLSAILSDTLMFRSATCTPMDREAAEALAPIAGVKIEDYAEQMFRAGEDLSGRTPEDIAFSDLKEFRFGALSVAAAQSLFMTESVFAQA